MLNSLFSDSFVSLLIVHFLTLALHFPVSTHSFIPNIHIGMPNIHIHTKRPSFIIYPIKEDENNIVI